MIVINCMQPHELRPSVLYSEYTSMVYERLQETCPCLTNICSREVDVACVSLRITAILFENILF